MKKYIFQIVFLLSVAGSFAQQKYNFYLELSDLRYTPTVTVNADNTIKLTTGNTAIDNIYKKYTIYSFTRCTPNALSLSLQKTFTIECSDIQLMNDLRNGFPSIYVMVEQYVIPPDGGALYTPNDYSIQYNIDPTFEQKYLDMINAKGAWDITHGSNDIKIGIADDGFDVTHEELVNKNITSYGTIPPYIPGSSAGGHGTFVAGLAAGDTDNGKGLSSIGFNSGLILARGYSTSNLVNLGTSGARVVNASFGYVGSANGGALSPVEQNHMNDLYNQNVVVVAAAGNGTRSGGPLSSGVAVNAENYSKRYYYPASYKNVISVSTVGNWNEPYTTVNAFDNWKDIHKMKTPAGSHYNGITTLVTETEIFNEHNDSVDIVVPAYRLPYIGVGIPNYYYTNDDGNLTGTSFSSPIVCGAIALMFSVNDCLKPKEVESILKLTAVNIEDMPENLPYKGRLGAGSLDAYKAVNMANQMALPQGTVNVTDRILYRWFYKLETAPYEIKMSNNKVTDKAKIIFKANNNIEILSGDYNPTNPEGYIILEINSTQQSCQGSVARIAPKSTGLESLLSKQSKLFPNPNKGIFTIMLSDTTSKDISVDVFDIVGKLVHSSKANEPQFDINVSNLPSGMYFAKISSNSYNETLKFIKE